MLVSAARVPPRFFVFVASRAGRFLAHSAVACPCSKDQRAPGDLPITLRPQEHRNVWREQIRPPSCQR
ncbi:hypothetical protein MRX96_005204 [Rhipicephalus microplus]